VTRGEKKAQEFFHGHGLRAVKISRKASGGGKVPDFMVYKGDRLAFYCEEKSLERSDRTQELIDKELQNPKSERVRVIAPGSYVVIVKDGKNPGSRTRIADRIHEAVGQFDSINGRLKYPNVLCFSNFGGVLSAEDLAQILEVKNSKSSRLPISVTPPSGDVMNRIKDEKYRIHLYIWLDAMVEDDEPKCFWNSASEHYDKLLSCFPESIRSDPECFT
jgi:hypothetical protein